MVRIRKLLSPEWLCDEHHSPTLQCLFVAFCGLVNQHRTGLIEFQSAQITALLEKLGKNRILLTDDQRRLQAVKGKSIGRKALQELTTIVTADTILRWHREVPT